MTKLPTSTLGLIALWLLPGLGPRRIYKLWHHFTAIEPIFDAKPGFLADLLSIEQAVAESIPGAMASKELLREVDLIDKHGIQLLDITQPEYPPDLREIHNPPPVLYIRGDYSELAGFNLAFVGSRKASYAGKRMAEKIIKELAACYPDTVIVSGLALGIDTSCHQAALDCGLKTVAVLANGLAHVYPERNRSLSRSIERQGCLVSEFPMRVKPIANHFPLRNRIISGLSKGVIVVEAGEKSGATITAGYALEQNRELFALPGPADSAFFRGTNRLIQRSHAKLIMSATDILEELQLGNFQLTLDEATSNESKENEALDPVEKTIISLLRTGITQKDRLIDHAGLPVNQLLSALTRLELKGCIIGKPGAQYEIIE